MAFPVREPIFCRGLRLVAACAVALGSAACSFDLGSLSPGSGKELPPQNAVAAVATDAGAATNPRESQVHATRAQTLSQAGKMAEALAELNIALDLDPHSAKAFQQRGLLYQNEKQHELAVADFTSANGLTPQQPDPLLGRATSYLALGKAKEAAIDLDEAVQAWPQNAQFWILRGTAHEKLGDKDKAADSYSRALLMRPRDEAARSGLARVGGKAG